MNEKVMPDNTAKADFTPLGAPVPTFPETFEQSECNKKKKRRDDHDFTDTCCHSSKLQFSEFYFEM